MRCLVAWLVWMLLAPALVAQTVKLPAEVKAPVNRLVQVVIEYDGDDLRFDVPSETAQIDAFREYDPDPKKIKLRVIAYAAGKYRLTAVTCKGGKLSDYAVCVFTAEGGPAPPVPPIPPDPPAPVDPLTKAFQAAYDAETGPQKAADLTLLAELLGSVVEAARKNSAITTNLIFTAKVTEARRQVIGERLPGVRAQIGVYLNAQLPRPEQAVSETYWAQAERHYANVARALREVRR